MSKGLKTVLVLVLAGFFATTALATQTRVNTMGGMDIWLRDDVNLDWNPALLPWYAEQVTVEYGFDEEDPDLQSIAVRLTNNDEQSMGVFGLVLNPHPENVLILSVPNPGAPLMPPGDVPNTGFPSNSPNIGPEQFWKLMWGKRLGDQLSIGLGLNMGGNSATSDSSGNQISEDKISMVGINPGVTLELGEESIYIDIGGRFSKTSFSFVSGDTTFYENTGGSHITLGGRAWFELSDYGYLVPAFGFNSSDMSWENSLAPVVETIDKRSSLFAGLGLQVMPTEETTVLVAAYYGSLKNEYTTGLDTTTTWTNTTAPGWVVGVESDLTSWLTGRMGASKHSPRTMSMEFIGPYKGEVKTTNAPFDLAVGVALHFLDFRVDTELHPDFLFFGPDFIGGQSTQPFVQISILYDFSGM